MHRDRSPSELPVRTVRLSVSTVKDRAPWLTLAALVVLGAISGIAYYLGFVRPYLLSDYYARPLLDLAKINKATPQSANEWAFTWVVVFACYWAAFRICPPAEGVTRAFRRTAFVLICAGAAFSALTLLYMYPVGAADLFDQIFRARLTSHYALNPFTTVPGSIAGDPLQAYCGMAWRFLALWSRLGVAGSRYEPAGRRKPLGQPDSVELLVIARLCCGCVAQLWNPARSQARVGASWHVVVRVEPASIV